MKPTGVQLSLVKRLLWEQEIVGSNPATPTIKWPDSSAVEPCTVNASVLGSNPSQAAIKFVYKLALVKIKF